MTNKLKQYFPMLRTRQEVLAEIQGSTKLQKTYASWTPEHQDEFLDICTGMRGLKILYDFMAKEILNPETVPERLESLLTCVLGRDVHITAVLPADSTRLADETSLLITDIVVEFDDGEVGNVEVQRVGYLFPGQRCACYSADLLLRQYKRVRDQRKKHFSYRDIRQVYTIVFFEHSPAAFHAYPGTYLHRFEQRSDTGLKLELLQKFYFVPLDIYRKIYDNKGITNKLEGWLAFLSMDDPDAIIRLIGTYPEFQAMYEHIFNVCRNMEDIMGLFSEELLELDRNTVRYMVDEMQETIEKKNVMLDEQKEQLDKQKELLDKQKEQLDEKQGKIEELQGTIEKQQDTIEKQQGAIDKLQAAIEELKRRLDV